jgi:Flp pilus assembly protein TadG
MALIMTVVLLIPLGCLAALFLDVGRLYALRVRMQVAADAAALAAASALIDGDSNGDSVQARADRYVAMNPIYTTPASLESLYVNTDEGTVRVILRYRTGALLWAPAGLTVRMAAGARADGVQPGETGRPIPNGNAFGWWKNEKTNPGAKDSALVRLAT